MSAAKLSTRTRVVVLRRSQSEVEFRVLDYYANELDHGTASNKTEARRRGGEIAAEWRERMKAMIEPLKSGVGNCNGLL